MSVAFHALIVLAVAYAVWEMVAAVQTWRTRRGVRGAVADFTRALLTEGVDERSTEHLPIRLAFQSLGLNVQGRERFAFWGAVGLAGAVGLVAAMLVLPPLAWPVGLLAGWFAVRAWVEGRWQKYKRRIDKELPLFLTRFASMLQVTPNVMQAIQEALESLPSDSPLKSWLEALLKSIQRNPAHVLNVAEAEAGQLSNALLLVTRELRRVWETGGQGYVEAFRLSAENLGHLLEARAEALAVAAGAWGTIRTIILAMVLAFFVVSREPQVHALLYRPASQLLLVLLVMWGGVGYWYIQGLIREVEQ